MINKSLVSLLLPENEFKLVRVSFDALDANLPNEARTYIYKTNLDLKVNDIVLVSRQNKAVYASETLHPQTITGARVIEVDVEDQVDFENTNITYKWVLDVLSLDKVVEAQEKETQFVKSMQRQANQARREQLKQAILNSPDAHLLLGGNAGDGE